MPQIDALTQAALDDPQRGDIWREFGPIEVVAKRDDDMVCAYTYPTQKFKWYTLGEFKAHYLYGSIPGTWAHCHKRSCAEKAIPHPSLIPEYGDRLSEHGAMRLAAKSWDTTPHARLTRI